VDLVRNIQDPMEASKSLVDHALARFSTDNLSVMIVRFDPKKLQSNTTTNIGVETEEQKEKGMISEVEMLVAEARRHSGAVREGAIEDEKEAEELRESVIKETEEEQETGPEFTPDGGAEAEKLLAERNAQKPSEDGQPKKEESGS
jgi:protein phosphatase PTC1